MPETGAGDDNPDYAERIAASADVEKGAWQRTLEDMKAMAEELEEEGWDVLTIAAGHTAPTNPDAGETDRWGLVHVVPGNKAEPFAEMVDTGKFPQYQVFRNEMNSRAFVVTQLLDPDTEQAILIAGNFELRHAPGLVTTALEEDEMYTHVQKLDGTHLGSFRHDDAEKFFPNPQRYEQYMPDDGDADADETDE
ncbi:MULTISPECIES: DUF7529 family protein [Halorussus]|uniref:DUF7529 family protein n=1 Tax=Halorussus TaxID=1070314 RepID=UPI0020A181C4|nr:hypothetical protein [Halorussus vallis]USZ74145.1 hypothetical protein NGM07_11855 [Halorussus vallis]